MKRQILLGGASFVAALLVLAFLLEWHKSSTHARLTFLIHSDVSCTTRFMLQRVRGTCIIEREVDTARQRPSGSHWRWDSTEAPVTDEDAAIGSRFGYNYGVISL